jgi:hypothetical protein
LKAVTAPEFDVPSETSHFPEPHSAKPLAHVAATFAISAYGMTMPKPDAPVFTCRPNDKVMIPCGAFFA